MKIRISGGDSHETSQRELSVFAICALTDRREVSRRQLNIIGFALFCAIMASWAIKISLGCAVSLLMICIGFMLYSLYNESRVLRQVQRELLQLLRNTPQSDINEFFNQAVSDLHND